MVRCMCNPVERTTMYTKVSCTCLYEIVRTFVFKMFLSGRWLGILFKLNRNCQRVIITNFFLCLTVFKSCKRFIFKEYVIVIARLKTKCEQRSFKLKDISSYQPNQFFPMDWLCTQVLLNLLTSNGTICLDVFLKSSSYNRRSPAQIVPTLYIHELY